MLEELEQAIGTYHAKWHVLIGERGNKEFFHSLRPTAAGWKASDLADFDKRFLELREASEQVHLGWVNERWLATFCLKKTEPRWGIRIVKLMQRRPGSTDAVGLDHVDFIGPDMADAKATLKSEPALKWTEEKNGDNCKWLSLWFADTEAKLRSDTVLDVCIAEMNDIKKQLQA